MILDDEVEQIGGFLFRAGVKLLVVKGLVDGTEGTLETPVLFDAEQAGKIIFHRLDDVFGGDVVENKRCLAAGLFDGQSAVIVAVEQVESVGIVGDDFEHILAQVVYQSLLFQRTGKELHRLLHFKQFFSFFFQLFLVDRVTLNQIVT